MTKKQETRLRQLLAVMKVDETRLAFPGGCTLDEFRIAYLNTQ